MWIRFSYLNSPLKMQYSLRKLILTLLQFINTKSSEGFSLFVFDTPTSLREAVLSQGGPSLHLNSYGLIPVLWVSVFMTILYSNLNTPFPQANLFGHVCICIKFSHVKDWMMCMDMRVISEPRRHKDLKHVSDYTLTVSLWPQLF